MIWTLTDLSIQLECERMRGHTLAFVNGCFDVFHAGHVGILELAAKAADIVVVALDGDERVRLLKGPGRPVHTLADRSRCLASMRHVHYVTSFATIEDYMALLRLGFDVMVKGADYQLSKAIVGRHLVPKVLFAPVTHSSSAIVARG